jgi:four helix bundle protein
MEKKPASYAEWEAAVPAEIRGDSVWQVRAYRFALFLADLAWYDAGRLMSDKRSLGIVDQLVRAVGSISANLEEGYSKGTGRDRARFYEYALGSARESRGWYYKGRHVLGELIVSHRMQRLTEVIKLLLTMVPDQRHSQLREDAPRYQTQPITVSKVDDDATSLSEQTPIPW